MSNKTNLSKVTEAFDVVAANKRIKILEEERKSIIDVLLEVEIVMSTSPLRPKLGDDVSFQDIELWNKTLSSLRIVLSEVNKEKINNKSPTVYPNFKVDTRKDKLTKEQKIDVLRFCGYSNESTGDSLNQPWASRQICNTLNYKIDNLSPPETTVILQYLSTLERLESELIRDDDNKIITDSTTWRPDIENIRERLLRFSSWSMKLCGFLGVSPGTGIQ